MKVDKPTFLWGVASAAYQVLTLLTLPYCDAKE